MIAEEHIRIAEVYRNSEFIGDGPAANLDMAIRHYLAAIQLYTRTTEPVDWALSHVNVGAAYSNRISGIKRGNFKLAVKHYNKALEVFTRDTHREEWAITKFNLAEAYHQWPVTTGNKSPAQTASDQSARVERCILHGEHALEVYTPTQGRAMWMRLKQIVVTAYKCRAIGTHVDRKEKFLKHVAEYVDGLDTLDMDVLDFTPEEKASHHCLLEVMMLTFVANGSSGDMDAAAEAEIASAVEKLQVATKDDDPTAWAINQIEHAGKCFRLSDSDQRCQNVENGIGYLEAATEVFTRAAFPDKWADVQMQLCAAYMQRVEGVRRENMEKAMRCFDKCKEVRPNEQLPDEFLKKQWARGADARQAIDRRTKEEGSVI
jgi:tetratricopeptide (TPR) repeat protein